MTDVDPYVAPPSEPAPTPRLARWRGWLALAALLLLLGSIAGTRLVSDRQDPTLEIPDGAPTTVPADPALDGPAEPGDPGQPAAPGLPTPTPTQ